MCTSVIADSSSIETPDALAAWLGVDTDALILIQDGLPDAEFKLKVPDWTTGCLCPVDIEATLDKFGVCHWYEEGSDPMETHAARLT